MKNFFLILLFFGLLNSLSAQTAEGFFHLAAHKYIDGQMGVAEQILNQGLQRYPDDPHLKALLEKLKKQKQQQQNQQQKQQQQAQAQKDKPQKQKKKQEKKKQQQKSNKKKMDKKEAERILNALREQEQNSEKKKAPIRATRRNVDKDW